jgi:hypothetical protein
MNKAKRSVGMAKFPYDRGAVLEGLIDGGNSTQIFQGGNFFPDPLSMECPNFP